MIYWIFTFLLNQRILKMHVCPGKKASLFHSTSSSNKNYIILMKYIMYSFVVLINKHLHTRKITIQRSHVYSYPRYSAFNAKFCMYNRTSIPWIIQNVLYTCGMVRYSRHYTTHRSRNIIIYLMKYEFSHGLFWTK